jgi:hypothetical protein
MEINWGCRSFFKHCSCSSQIDKSDPEIFHHSLYLSSLSLPAPARVDRSRARDSRAVQVCD